jgi:RNA polymerase sigma-70 factor (ECF subfamily)
MQRLFVKSRAEEFGFTLAEFCAAVNEAAGRALQGLRSESERSHFIESLHLEELVLARACARGNQAAWDRFLLLYRSKLYAAARAISRDDSVARELADSLYADLFGTRTREDGSRVTKLDSYSGRGSLEGWLKAVLAQQYVDRLRSQPKMVSLDENVECRSAAAVGGPPPAEHRQVNEATDAVLGELSAEERYLLAAYYLDGKTLAAIGHTLKVHESTIKRRIERTMVDLRKKILARLSKSGITRAAAEEILELDVRDLEVDVRNRLAQERQA